MLFKMRVLFFSKAGNAESIAQAIARKYKTTSDQIPPAYPSDNEKLMIIGFEGGGKPDKQVIDFCSNLTTQRVKNIAFFVVTKGGGEAAVEVLKEAVKKRGINIAGDTHVVKVGGLLKQSGVKQAEVDATIAWADKIIDDLTEK